MQSCKGCREQQIPGDGLCLQCIEDLNSWLREIPDLYAELGLVRLPGSVASRGPRTSAPSRTASPSPVRLEVLDLLDRGETLARLQEWTDTGTDVRSICDGFRHHLLSIAGEPWAGNFWRAMRALCRDLARTVGQPEERPVGKCSQPGDSFTDELCRGQLMRLDTGGVYCRRCGDKPDVRVQPAWVTLREAAIMVGKPIETIRTWYKRGRLGWDQIGPSLPNRAWLPAAASLATEPQPSAIVNHGSRAELSADQRPAHDGRHFVGTGSAVSDADVLGRVAPGNVTPPASRGAGKDTASVRSTSDPAPHLSAGSDPSAVRKEAKRLREPAFPGFESPVADGITQ